MNVFKRFKKFISNKSARYENIGMQALLDFLGVDKDLKGSALSEATYYACNKVLCEAIGKLPLKLLRYNDKNGVTSAKKHYLYNLLHDRPNKYMTATSFWSTVEFNRNHYGNAYVLIWGAGTQMSLWILPSSNVEIWYDDACILSYIPDIYYIYSIGGHRYQFASEEILHFKSSNTLDGIKGISVRDTLATTIDGNRKAQKMLNKLYDNGFTSKLALQYTGNINDDNTTAFVAGIERYARGEMKDRGVENIIPIPPGSKLESLNTKLTDSQFIEIKQYSALQIASAFGIKPYQIGDYTKSSYASADAQQLSFYVDTLLYIIKQYEEEISYKLLSKQEIADGYYAKFNVAVILRADLRTQIETLSQAVSNFIYTPNEARAMLDKEAKEGGDELIGNGSTITVRQVGVQWDGNSNDGKGGEKSA